MHGLQALGTSTLLLYAISLLVSTRKWDPPAIRKPFSVRVVVPCYKEDIETLEETVECAIQAAKIALDKNMANAGVLYWTVLLCACIMLWWCWPALSHEVMRCISDTVLSCVWPQQVACPALSQP